MVRRATSIAAIIFEHRAGPAGVILAYQPVQCIVLEGRRDAMRIGTRCKVAIGIEDVTAFVGRITIIE